MAVMVTGITVTADMESMENMVTAMAKTDLEAENPGQTKRMSNYRKYLGTIRSDEKRGRNR